MRLLVQAAEPAAARQPTSAKYHSAYHPRERGSNRTCCTGAQRHRGRRRTPAWLPGRTRDVDTVDAASSTTLLYCIAACAGTVFVLFACPAAAVSACRHVHEAHTLLGADVWLQYSHAATGRLQPPSPQGLQHTAPAPSPLPGHPHNNDIATAMDVSCTALTHPGTTQVLLQQLGPSHPWCCRMPPHHPTPFPTMHTHPCMHSSTPSLCLLPCHRISTLATAAAPCGHLAGRALRHACGHAQHESTALLPAGNHLLTQAATHPDFLPTPCMPDQYATACHQKQGHEVLPWESCPSFCRWAQAMASGRPCCRAYVPQMGCQGSAAAGSILHYSCQQANRPLSASQCTAEGEGRPPCPRFTPPLPPLSHAQDHAGVALAPCPRDAPTNTLVTQCSDSHTRAPPNTMLSPLVYAAPHYTSPCRRSRHPPYTYCAPLPHVHQPVSADHAHTSCQKVQQ